MTSSSHDARKAHQLAENHFRSNGIEEFTIETREYPEETILIVRVPVHQQGEATAIAGALDQQLAGEGFRGFVVVRPQDPAMSNSPARSRGVGLADPRAALLANLLAARSRTSEAMPSLTYIRDSADNLESIQESRHHLVFGRRGAGKTALLVEAKRSLERRDNIVAWRNIQTISKETVWRAYLWAAQTVVDALGLALRPTRSQFRQDADLLSAEITAALAQPATPETIAQQMVPKLQRLVGRALAATDRRLFLFLDDLHYFERSAQPQLLDLLHGSFRDTKAWLKVAAIRHLCRWFQTDPPLGLQTGHDAAHIDLDLTLESPSEAKQFLDQMLDTFANHVGAKDGRSFFSDTALDRLLLASGAVPRDYLELAASAIREALKRQGARLVGVEDITRAAGKQSKLKLQELEDDAAGALGGGSTAIVRALNRVRSFCLDEKRITFFRVDFHDKEQHPAEYSLITSLLEMRIIHLISQSLSDKHEAGRRAEVYMLDLSQFSSDRQKKNIWSLDFTGGHMVLKLTGSKEEPKRGDTSRRLHQILRRGPVFSLKSIATPETAQPEIASDGAARRG